MHKTDFFPRYCLTYRSYRTNSKYITPFGYCEGVDIVSNGSLDCTLVAIGAVIGISGMIIAYLKYTKKDIH